MVVWKASEDELAALDPYKLADTAWVDDIFDAILPKLRKFSSTTSVQRFCQESYNSHLLRQAVLHLLLK